MPHTRARSPVRSRLYFLAVPANMPAVRSRRMPLPLHRLLNIAAGCLVSALATSCISNKAFWQKHTDPGTLTVSGYYPNEGLPPPLILTTEQITNSVVGTESNGTTRVSYAKDLQPQAALVARAMEQTLTQTEQTLGVPLALRPHIYLLRMPNERRVVRFSMSIPETNAWQTMPWLMLLTKPPPETGPASAPDPEALWADLQELPTQVFLVTHELSEMRLIDPKELLVMGDFSGKIGFIPFNLKYHTRWFRDGFANYTAYKAGQCFRRQMAEAGLQPGTLRFIERPKQPFSELARVKDKVFDWNQNSPTACYGAATALFLLIEQRKGSEAITAIINELPKVKFPNGKALLKMIRQKTGMDLRQLARTFQFPDLGLETHSSAQGRCEIANVAPDGWATRAKLRQGDVLLEANAWPVTDFADIELQVLKALDQGQKLSLTFSRNEERHVTEALPLPVGNSK